MNFEFNIHLLESTLNKIIQSLQSDQIN